MNVLIFALAVASLTWVSGSPRECAAVAPGPSLNHVVLVVRDLDRASDRFREQGFRLKEGRLHANNLLNRHVKFRDGSSLELMTVRGEPRDAMSRDYAELAASGEGGVYVALEVHSVTVAEGVAAALRLETRASSSGPWRFLSFPPASPAAAVFFSDGSTAVQDPDDLVSHKVDVAGLSEAWVEGGGELIDLLERLGARRCGSARAPDGRTGERLGLARGRIVIVQPREPERPRVLGAVLRLRSKGGGTVWPHPAFWVEYR
jgi:catechol 2,3-dioxygenase-like lactoylglutathione lyase family enzyme